MPSTEPELPVFDDIGVDVKDDENCGEEETDNEDGDDDNKVGLKTNNAFLKPGLKSQS